MKFKHICTIAVLLSLTACFGLKPEDYDTLSPITFSQTSSIVDVSLGEPLIFDALKVESALPVTYEWAYGKRKSGGDETEMESMQVISTDPQINYVFNKLGSFVLRLRVDNGQTIAYRYFTLNVNSGLDEGLLVLCNDISGKGRLTFIKERTAQEVADGATQIWEDIFTTMNPSLELVRPTAMMLSSYSSDGISYNHLVIATDDEQGSVFDVEPKTMVNTITTPMRTQTGSYCTGFAGCQTAKTGSYTFMRGADGHVYRYDLFTPLITERSDVFTATGGVTNPTTLLYNVSSLTQKAAFLYKDGLCQPSTSATTTLRPTPAGWKLVNFCTDRDANKVYVLMQSTSDASQWAIKSTTGTLSAYTDVTTFTASSVNMDESSIFCTSIRSNDAYYSYKDKIWRWSLSGQPSLKPTLTFPNGERVCALASNFMGNFGDGSDEMLLYVATYAESTGKGSIYVYDISTDTLVKSYTGICDRPVQLLYKYRIP